MTTPGGSGDAGSGAVGVPATTAQSGVHYPRVADGLAIAVLILIGIVLVGWALDVRMLESGVPGLATMKVNTALCLGATAFGILLRDRPRAVLALVGFVAVVCVLVLIEHVTGRSLGIDELVVDDPSPPGTNRPGQMAPGTAVALLFLAAAHFFVVRGRRRPAEWSTAVGSMIGGLALLGYAYGAEALYGVGFYSSIAVNTAAALLALGVGIGLLIPGSALTWTFSDDGPGGILMRRIVVVGLVAFPLLGLLHLYGERTGLYDPSFAIALTITLASLLLLGATYSAGIRLSRIEASRADTVAELEALTATLEEGRDLEWRRAEELSHNLELERAMFRRAVAKVDDVVWTAEVRERRLVELFASPDAAGVFGESLPAGTTVISALHDRVHPADHRVRDAFRAQVLAGRPADAEVRLLGFDGRVRWVWVRCTPRMAGERHFVDGIATNVTDRHELAEKRDRLLAAEQEQVRQLREINRLREEFLAITGHEMRTPLAAILGYADLLLEDPSLDGRHRRALGVIAKRSRQLHQLVDDLFELTRFNAGLESLHLELLDIDALIGEVLDDHRSTAEEADVEVTYRGGPLMMSADPIRIRQVLDNLLSNAIKYTLRGGHVQITQTPSPDGHTVLITVADDGIGIPEREREWVFDRMFRASTAQESGVQGTGLGLAVVRTLVEAHGGTVTVAANQDVGTVFTVQLPIGIATQA